ncbi:MAG TPA: glycosyltransferase [Candidatus Polarisedimenticolia bacterium]|nr:glycosyltransferase [Candidatus Polarisedimenticolia bacterium]
MSARLQSYAEFAGQEVLDHLHQLARFLKGRTVVHVNSTRVGGGVAEILARLVPLKRELGLDVSWEVVEGDADFFAMTKRLHNGLQGNTVNLPRRLIDSYEQINRANAERLRSRLEEADFVFIHDPQPAPLLGLCPKRKGLWVWRCHIDVSRPNRAVWKLLREHVKAYDASIFSLAAFAQPLPHPQYLVPPSIDPLSEKNLPLEESEVREVSERFGLDPDRPVVAQVSRFDRFKDPVGVIRAFRLVKAHTTAQLVLAGGTATDDPEGEEVLQEVREESGNDPDVHILLLPADAHRTINALQRRADVILQKSVREGFGLTVTEALWKSRPVVGGRTGGITLQVVDRHTGFLVSTPEGAALRTRYLLRRPGERREMGEKGRRFVKDHFLLTRHLREYLTLMVGIQHASSERIEVA